MIGLEVRELGAGLWRAVENETFCRCKGILTDGLHLNGVQTVVLHFGGLRSHFCTGGKCTRRRLDQARIRAPAAAFLRPSTSGTPSPISASVSTAWATWRGGKASADQLKNTLKLPYSYYLEFLSNFAA